MKTAQWIVFLSIVICIMVPVVKWYLSPELTQMQIFLNTWMFSFYGIIVYVVGVSAIQMMWDE